MSESGLFQQCTLRKLDKERRPPGLQKSRRDEILDIPLAELSKNWIAVS